MDQEKTISDVYFSWSFITGYPYLDNCRGFVSVKPRYNFGNIFNPLQPVFQKYMSWLAWFPVYHLSLHIDGYTST